MKYDKCTSTRRAQAQRRHTFEDALVIVSALKLCRSVDLFLQKVVNVYGENDRLS